MREDLTDHLRCIRIYTSEPVLTDGGAATRRIPSPETVLASLEAVCGALRPEDLDPETRSLLTVCLRKHEVLQSLRGLLVNRVEDVTDPALTPAQRQHRCRAFVRAYRFKHRLDVVEAAVRSLLGHPETGG